MRFVKRSIGYFLAKLCPSITEGFTVRSAEFYGHAADSHAEIEDFGFPPTRLAAVMAIWHEVLSPVA